jgi:SM-20-related protein
MPSLEVFRRLGVFYRHDVVDDATCSRIGAAMRGASGEVAQVFRGDEGAVDRRARRSRWISVNDADRRLVQSAFDALVPAMMDHFGLTLTGSEGAGFLAYGVGDFYAPHRDRHVGANPAIAERRRLVSVVLFLNDASWPHSADGYDGGELRLYGLMADPRFAECGLPFPAAHGLVVAFRSEIVHEVTPVSGGHRCTAVDRFF